MSTGRVTGAERAADPRTPNTDGRKAAAAAVCESLCVGETASTKSGHERTVPIPGKLLAMLAGRKTPAAKGEDYVAPSARGTPWSDKTLYPSLVRACARLGLDRGRVHALRHFFVTTMFMHGKSARVVQKLAGHSTLTVTQRYADATSEAMADAVSVFDLPHRLPLKVIAGGRANGR
jgi:integrase